MVTIEPFENIEDMNYHIIGKYLRVVQPDDTVFILGDITIKRNSSFKPILAEIIKTLPGKKHFVPGNHDYYTKKFYLEDCGFVSFNRKIITEKYVIVHNPSDFTLSERDSGKILIHGHQHHHERPCQAGAGGCGGGSYRPFFRHLRLLEDLGEDHAPGAVHSSQ